MKTEQVLSESFIINIFESKIEEIMGKETKCVWGIGKWDYFLSGKKLLNSVVNTGMFLIKNRNNEYLQGNTKVIEIAKALIRKGDNLPDDFMKLKELLLNITKHH